MRPVVFDAFTVTRSDGRFVWSRTGFNAATTRLAKLGVTGFALGGTSGGGGVVGVPTPIGPEPPVVVSSWWWWHCPRLLRRRRRRRRRRSRP